MESALPVWLRQPQTVGVEVQTFHHGKFEFIVRKAIDRKERIERSGESHKVIITGKTTLKSLSDP